MAADEHELLRRAKDMESMLPYWDQVGAIVEGYHAIKLAGKTYLPMFPDELQADYDFRLENSKLTNIYRDVLEGLASKPFEEEISLIGGEEVPDEMEEFAEDVDGAGNNLTMFAATLFFNGINNALDWIFVDYPTLEPGKAISIADAKAQNIKPFWSHVLARNVLEARTKMVNSKETLTYIRIFEPKTDQKKADRVRVFERSDVGLVTWQLYERNPEVTSDKPEAMTPIDGGTLSINVIPLVPFATGRRDGRTFKFFPAMRDAADLQITLYRNESALEWIKTMAGYPMLAANGMKPQYEADGKTPKKIAVGPARVMYGPPDGNGGHGEWKFIEPSANSMEFLQKNIDKTKQDLRELGRQPLTALSTQLTTVTTSIAAGKARSAVTAWALALKDALENAFKITAAFEKSNYEVEVNVYTGFDNVADDSKDLETLTKARENRDLSQETYLFELKRRKVLSPEFKYEDELKKLLTEVPTDGEVDDENPDDAPNNNSGD